MEGAFRLPGAVNQALRETRGKIISDCTHSVLKKYFAGSSN